MSSKGDTRNGNGEEQIVEIEPTQEAAEENKEVRNYHSADVLGDHKSNRKKRLPKHSNSKLLIATEVKFHSSCADKRKKSSSGNKINKRLRDDSHEHDRSYEPTDTESNEESDEESDDGSEYDSAASDESDVSGGDSEAEEDEESGEDWSKHEQGLKSSGHKFSSNHKSSSSNSKSPAKFSSSSPSKTSASNKRSCDDSRDDHDRPSKRARK